MSAHLITLQDYDVGIRSEADLVGRSPGFANIATGKPVFGEAARQLFRLHPRESFNQFWAQLSLDPLPVKNKFFRHTADLAHGHLRSLADPARLQEDTVIAVPPNYTRNQLSVLLGITRACEIPVHGLVDMALLHAMASDSGADHVIIIDLQLHQAVLTTFRRVDGQMQRERVLQVPASGLLALQDAWTNLIADEFIRQTRFDPKHNAEIEQYLYNSLDGWLAQSAAKGELLIDLDHKGSVHQARLTHEAFQRRSQQVAERIRKELDTLRTPDSAVHLLRSQLQLPGLASRLPGLLPVDEDAVLETFLRKLPEIRRSPEQVQFITSLPLDAVSRPAAVAPRASHVLVGATAYALPEKRLVLGQPEHRAEGDRVLPWPAPQSGCLIIERQGREWHVRTEGLSGALHNGAALEANASLALGDELRAGEQVLRLIRVE